MKHFIGRSVDVTKIEHSQHYRNVVKKGPVVWRWHWIPFNPCVYIYMPAAVYEKPILSAPDCTRAPHCVVWAIVTRWRSALTPSTYGWAPVHGIVVVGLRWRRTHLCYTRRREPRGAYTRCTAFTPKNRRFVNVDGARDVREASSASENGRKMRNRVLCRRRCTAAAQLFDGLRLRWIRWRVHGKEKKWKQYFYRGESFWPSNSVRWLFPEEKKKRWHSLKNPTSSDV